MSMVIILLSIIAGMGQSQPLNIVLQSTSDEIPLLSEDYLRQNNDLFLIVNSMENRERKFGISISIEGGGIQIVSNGYRSLQTIQAFSTQTFNSFQLAEYFDIENLDFQGYSKDDYLQNGGLPSGVYDLCIELFDVTNDRGIPLSNPSCLTRSVDLIKAPEITSPLDLEIVKEEGFNLTWKHDSVEPQNLNYEIHIYEYDLNLTKSEHLLYKRSKRFKQRIKGELSEFISSKELDLISGLVYVVFVKVNDISKSYERQGYSEGKLIQIEGAQKVLCSGDVTFTQVESNSSFIVIEASVDGCAPLSFDWTGNQVGGGYSPYAYIQNIDQGLSVRIECEDGCIYQGTYGDQSCIAGTPCTPSDPCLINGTLSSDCVTCIGSLPSISMNQNQNVDGTTSYIPKIDCSGATYQWSNGSTESSLTIPNSDTNGYQVTVTCPGDCVYVGSVYPRDWVCITGGLCDDGDPCTINDEYNENCGCIGEGDCDTNPPCTDEINSFVGSNLDGTFALFANVDCDVAEIIWYPSLETSNAIVVDDLNGVSVVIKCSNGCVYSKNFCVVGTVCDDNDPCTINDTYDFNCNCIGQQLPDSDGDGVCDEEDQCPGMDDAECEDCNETTSICTHKLGLRKDRCEVIEMNVYNPETGETYLLNESSNAFKFPYTLDDGSLSQYPHIGKLVDHLQGWLQSIGAAGQVKLTESQNEYMLSIEGTALQFESVMIRCDNRKDKKKFDSTCVDVNDLMCDDDNPCTINDMYDADCNCIGVPVGLSIGGELAVTLDEDEQSLTASIGCDNATFVWSDGSTGASIHYLPGIYYSVTATCGTEGDEVPCSFIANYGEEFTCTPGTICEGPCEGMIYDVNCNCVPSLDFVNIELNEVEVNGTSEYTLVPEIDCGGTAMFIWNTGETTRNINIADPNALYTVEITCGACIYMGIYQGSDSDCIDCDESCTGSVIIEAEINSEDFLILTAISSCPADFYWSNGSNLPYIIVPADLNTYSVLAFCQDADCTYQAIYEGETTFCSPGQPCDDNDPCTTDDTYMIDCSCVGTPSDAQVSVDITEITAESCNYLWSDRGNDMDGYSYIEKIKIRLPDNTIITLDPSFNDDGFDFPYCNANENGEFCEDASTLVDLVEDLNLWIQGNYTGVVSFTNGTVPSESSELFNLSRIVISDSNLEFLSTESYTSVQSGIIGEFSNTGCDQAGAVIGYEYSASIDRDCEEISYLWSNGATTSFVSLDLANACIDLQLVCDGCIYTYSVDQDCQCVVGTPCIPSNGCAGIIDEHCNCIATSTSDVDGDGICDEEDECPGLNDNLYPNGCDEIDCSLLEIQSRTEEDIDVNETTVVIHQVETLNCPTATYLWSNGSTSSSIQVAFSIGLYTVTVTCGDCEEVLNFGDESCTLGLVGESCPLDECYTTPQGYIDADCNCVGEYADSYYSDIDEDGIPDCMDDCDFGISPGLDENGDEICCDSPPTLEYAQEFFEVRDYCIVLPSNANTLEDIVIKVDDEDVHLNAEEGFNFPYCIATGCVTLGGGPIDDFIAPNELDLLTDFVRDLIKWGGNQGKYFQAIIYDEDEADQSSCGTTSLHIEIKGFPYAMTRIITDLGMIGMPVLPGYQGDPYYTINLIPHEDCDMESIEWSDGRSWTIGDTDPMPLTRGPLYSENIGYRVTVTCANGCEYIIETPDVNCIVGEPCTPVVNCAPENSGVFIPGPYGCYCEPQQPLNDADGDGVCDEEDICDGFDDNVDFDGNGIPDGCDECKMDCISQRSALPEKSENYVPDYYLLEELEISYQLDEETSQTLLLTNLPEFNFPYILCDNGCENFNPNSFISDFNDWSVSEGLDLSIGAIEFTESDIEYVLHFVNSDIVIVDLWHQMYGSLNGSSFVLGKGSINPPENCYPSTCCYVGTKAIADCSMLNDIIVFHDGQEVSLFDMVELGSYSVNKQFNFSDNCTQNSSSFNNLIEDLLSADIELSTVRSGQFLVFTFCSERFELKSLVWDQNIETETNGNPEIIIDLEEECIVGCNDGDPCTTDDHFVTLPDGTCSCQGTYTDTDGDGICDEIDECDEYPDQYDIDGDGVADICDDPWIVCNAVQKNYAQYFIDRLECAHIHEGELPHERKLLVNNLVEWQHDFVRRFGVYDDNGTQNPYDDSWTPPTASAGFPFPELIDELVIFVGSSDPSELDEVDEDGDGMVDFLDPVPGTPARILNGHILDDIHEKSQMIAGFNDAQDIITDFYFNSSGTEDEAFREIKRFSLWNQILFTAYTTVSLDLPIITNQSLLGRSPCLAGFDWIPLVIQDEDEIEINGSGWIKDPVGGCWIEVEVGCGCECNIIYHPDADGDGDCNETEIIGTTCTDDEQEADADAGIVFVQCPPLAPNPCFVYGLVSNPDYNPYDEDGNYLPNYDTPPCNCEALNADANGNPPDHDGDGVCDALDECDPSYDDLGNLITDEDDPLYTPYDDKGDEDGDGVPDCIDKCLGLDNAELLAFAIDPDFPPTGPGDPCDDGNPCTYDDVITEECGCSGVYVDLDGDGVYDCEECDVDDIILDLTNDDGTVEPYIPTVVYVDEKGRPVGSDEPGAILWSGCDLCPGLDDRAYTGPEVELEEGELPPYDDYDNDGLPDCIDPPWKDICPDDFEITEDGLVLIFNTDDLDASDYPEPITFQGVTLEGSLVNEEYLLVNSAREVDGITEVLYLVDIPYDNADDFTQANIVFSEHQVCNLTDSEVVSLSCPTGIKSVPYFRLEFDVPANADFDLSDLFGEISINGSAFTPSTGDYSNSSNKLKLTMPDDITYDTPFSGTIILANGLECTYINGTPEYCDNDNFIVVGDPCDDGDPCTHHDQYVDGGDDDCLCIGEARPDTDEDGLCDEIDPCPEEPNTAPDGDDEDTYPDCPCDLPTFGEAALVNDSDFEIHFNADNLENFTSIDVKIVREDGELVTKNIEQIQSPISIANLEHGFNYIILVSFQCDTGGKSIAQEFEVFIPFSDTEGGCITEFELIELTNDNALLNLNKGDTFTSTDFEVTVKHAARSGNAFTGTGYISIPYFNVARFNVSFNQIKINNHRQMVDGVIVINALGLAILGDDLSDIVNEGVNNIINVLTDLEDVLDELTPILEAVDASIAKAQGLVDQDVIDCVERLSGLIKEKEDEAKLALENNLPLDEQAIIKEQLDALLIELQPCQDELDAQLEALLGVLVEFIPYSMDAMANDDELCDLDPTAYQAIDEQYRPEFDATINTLLSQWTIDNGNAMETSDVITSTHTAQDEDFAVATQEELTTYYMEIMDHDFCYVVTNLDIGFKQSQGTTQLESSINVMIELFDEIDPEIIRDMSEKVREDMSNEDLYDQFKDEIVQAMKKVILRVAYIK